jgi:hypothetical protein
MIMSKAETERLIKAWLSELQTNRNGLRHVARLMIDKLMQDLNGMKQRGKVND